NLRLSLLRGSRRPSLLRGSRRPSLLRGSRRPSLRRLSRRRGNLRPLRPHGSRRVEQKPRPGARSSRAGQQQQQAKTVSLDASFERQPALRILSRADIERDTNGSSSIKDCPALKPWARAKLLSSRAASAGIDYLSELTICLWAPSAPTA